MWRKLVQLVFIFNSFVLFREQNKPDKSDKRDRLRRVLARDRSPLNPHRIPPLCLPQTFPTRHRPVHFEKVECPVFPPRSQPAGWDVSPSKGGCFAAQVQAPGKEEELRETHAHHHHSLRRTGCPSGG